ncbi:hypothetical protein EBT31_17630 [bacterium]|nr:hypothetical protein [bacterium]
MNYLSEYGIKRYYMIERGERGWFKLHVDVYPEDRTVFWNVASRDGFERDNYVDSYYMTDDGSVVIHIGDLQAYKDAVRCGFKTLTEVVAEQGGDIEELLTARAAELQMADELDLMFDTDPHEVNGSGTEQPSDPAEDQAEETDPASDADPTDDNGEDDTEDTDGPIA